MSKQVFRVIRTIQFTDWVGPDRFIENYMYPINDVKAWISWLRIFLEILKSFGGGLKGISNGIDDVKIVSIQGGFHSNELEIIRIKDVVLCRLKIDPRDLTDILSKAKIEITEGKSEEKT